MLNSLHFAVGNKTKGCLRIQRYLRIKRRQYFIHVVDENVKWFQMQKPFIFLIKIYATTGYFGLLECILSIPHLEDVLFCSSEKEKNNWKQM